MSENPLVPIWNTDLNRWNFRCASHLLQRAGFGGTYDEIRTLAAMTPQHAIASVINYQTQLDTLPIMTFGDLSGAANGDFRQKFRQFGQFTEDQRKNLAQISRLTV